MRGLYKFHMDFGRHGNLEGVFILESEKVASIMGETFYACDVLGKHSEVAVKLTTENLTLISEDPVIVDVFHEHVGSIGFHPLDYME